MHGITASESKRLAELEKVIHRGKKAFLEVGAALKEVRDSKLYKASHKSFAAYVEERFGFKRTYAHNLIESAEAVESVRNCEQIETESQAREVAKAPPEHRDEVIGRATEIADERGKQPTAAIYREAREEVLLDDQYEDVPDDDEPVQTGANRRDPVVDRARAKVPELVRQLRLQLDNLGLDFDRDLDRIIEAAR